MFNALMMQATSFLRFSKIFLLKLRLLLSYACYVFTCEVVVAMCHHGYWCGTVSYQVSCHQHLRPAVSGLTGQDVGVVVS